MPSNKSNSLMLFLKNLSKQWDNRNYDIVELLFPYIDDINKDTIIRFSPYYRIQGQRNRNNDNVN